MQEGEKRGDIIPKDEVSIFPGAGAYVSLALSSVSFRNEIVVFYYNSSKLGNLILPELFQQKVLLA